MKCPNCGTINKDNYCIKCGAIITNDGTIKQIRVEQQPSIYDDLEIFIDHNQNKILHSVFNWAAAFFSSIYLLYRKCYWEGILVLISQYLLSLLYFFIINEYFNFLPPILIMEGTIFLLFLHFLLFGVFANPYYIYRSKKKINQLKQSNTFTKEQLHNIGGVSLVSALCIPAFFFLIILIGFRLGIRLI